MGALDDVQKSIEAELNLARRDLLDRTGPIRAALDAYENAALDEAALTFCRDHSLKAPKVTGRSKSDSAELIKRLVLALPELKAQTPTGRSSDRLPSTTTGSEVSTESEAVTDEVAAAFRRKFPSLSSAASQGQLLVVGAFSGRTKMFPGPLKDAAEWIDTATDGNRAILGAVKRMKAGAIFAVILCEQLISHQHSEPITDAARQVKIPLAYGGKGGTAALARAIESLERALTSP